MNHKHVVHLTSVHPPFDIRIYHKECQSLAQAGYTVTLVVPHVNSEMVKEIQIKAVPPVQRRLARMMLTTWRVGQIAKHLKADLYHFHDSELIPVGLGLRLLGKKVIYDIHEDVPRDILFRDYLPSWLLRLASWLVERIENFASRHFSALIAATPAIGRRFEALSQHTIVINNYPILKELIPPTPISWAERPLALAYVGVISPERGLRQMVEAMAYLPAHLQAKLKLAGIFSPPQSRNEVAQLPGWQNVDELGFLDRQTVVHLLGQVRAGLVLFRPEPNHIEAQPNKMFEYMSAGLPVIASNFPLWRQVIETTGCGLLIDPLDPKAIAEAIHYVLTHPAEAEAMGRRGQLAVENHYNWASEATKLLQLYANLLEPTRITPKETEPICVE